TWHKEVLQIETEVEIYKTTQCSCYGILVDESTHREFKYFVVCIMFWDHKKNIPSVTVTNLEDLNNCTGQSVAD
ncbi:13633_t:CDS:1, partial [Racocetra persica]